MKKYKSDNLIYRIGNYIGQLRADDTCTKKEFTCTDCNTLRMCTSDSGNALKVDCSSSDKACMGTNH